MRALKSAPIVRDGAMGTQLHERGASYDTCLEELVVSRPELVASVHRDYARAGAELILANTFGANGLRLAAHALSHRVRELNLAAVALARASASDAWIGGSIGPSGHRLDGASDAELERVRVALREQADALVEANVDALVIETMCQRSELRAAILASKAASGGKVPVFAHVSVDEHGRMADGTSSGDVAKEMRELGADVIGINCSHGPTNVLGAIEPMLSLGLPVSAAPNAGLPVRVNERLVYAATPTLLGELARRMFDLGVRVVGGCCGTTPEHIERLAAARSAHLISHESPG